MSTTELPVLKTKYDEAMKIVKRNMGWSAGAGILPFPLFDMAAIAIVQVKEIKELAELYEVPFTKNIAKSLVIALVGTLGGGVVATTAAVASIKWLPVIGPLFAVTSLSASSAALSYAMGQVFIQHFEAGGTLLDFEPAKVKEYFRQQYANYMDEKKTGKPAAPVKS